MIPEAGLKTPLHRDDWTTMRLKYLFERKRRDLRPDDGVVTAFRDGVVTLRSNRREDGFTFADKEIGYQGVESGDLVIHAMDGFAGAIGVSDSRGKCSPVYTITVPRPNSEVHTGFWSYYLRNLAVTGFIESLAKGIRERSTDFRWNDAGNLLVNFPDQDTQKAIACFLDRETARIDQLIKKKRRMVEVLSEGFASYREHILADGVPTRLKFLSKFVTSGSRDWGSLYADNGDLFVRIGNISGSGIDLDLSKKVFVHLGDRTEGLRTRLVDNDLLISITANLGSVAVVGTCATGGYINQHVALVRLWKPQMARFIAHTIQTKRCEDEFALRGYGGTKQGLSLEDVKEISILLPSSSEQLEKTKALDKHFCKISRLCDQITGSIERLHEFRSALITSAVTGQINVATWDKQKTDRRLDLIEEDMAAQGERK